MALTARRLDLLEKNVAEIVEGGGQAIAVECDVTSPQSVHDAVAKVIANLGPLDLVVANAGISIPTRATNFKMENVDAIFRTNVYGMFYLFDAVIPAMIERGQGHFAGVASVAGLRGIPGSSAYSTSKAAMQTFLEASRVELKEAGVKVTIINPGFVDTPLTRKNKFAMPFLINPPEAAAIIANGLERGKRVIEFPLRMSILMRTVRHLPAPIFDRISSRWLRRRMDESLALR